MGNDDSELSTPGRTLADAVLAAESRGWVGADAREEARRVLSGADPSMTPDGYGGPDTQTMMTGTPDHVARSMTGVVTPPPEWCIVHETDLATCHLAGRGCVSDYPPDWPPDDPGGTFLVEDRVAPPPPDNPRPVQVIHPDGGSSALLPTSSETVVHRDRLGLGQFTRSTLTIDTAATDPAVGRLFVNLTVTYAGDPDGITRLIREAERRAQTLGWSQVAAMESVWDDVRAGRFRPADHPNGGS